MGGSVGEGEERQEERQEEGALNPKGEHKRLLALSISDTPFYFTSCWNSSPFKVCDIISHIHILSLREQRPF